MYVHLKIFKKKSFLIRLQQLIDGVTMQFEFLNHSLILFAMFNPGFVRALFLLAAITLGQILGINVLMQRRIITSMQEKSLFHALREEWFEECKCNVKKPALVDHMNRCRTIGQTCDHYGNHFLRN